VRERISSWVLLLNFFLLRKSGEVEEGSVLESEFLFAKD